MTQCEKTGIRDLTFSKWIRNKLPDSSTGFLVSDVDFFIYNYKLKKIMILEIKTRSTPMKFWQKKFYENLSRWMQKGIDEGWIFEGFKLIMFENTFFNDGKCWLNSKEISEQELIKILSFMGVKNEMV